MNTNNLSQGEQDAITLNYPKWSAQRRAAKLSTDHNLWQQERDRTLARQRRENGEAGRTYRASLDAAKAEKQREHDARIDRQIEPQKQMLKRDWLANHPGKTADDFDKSAWVHLRTNIIEQGKTDALEADITSNLATGEYSL